MSTGVWILVIVALFSQPTVSRQTQSDLDTHVTAVAWNSRGDTLALVGIAGQGSSGFIRTIDAESGQFGLSLTAQPGGFTSVVWSADDRYLAIGSFDQTVWIIDTVTGTHTATLWGHQSTVTDVDWSISGKLVSSGNWDGKLILWNVASAQPMITLQTGDLYSAEFSPDENLVSVGTNIGLYVFPSDLAVSTFQEQSKYKVIPGTVGSVDWSSDGAHLAAGTVTYDRNNARIVLIAKAGDTYAIMREFATESEGIYGIDWSADGKIVASQSIEGIVNVWDSETGNLIHTYFGGDQYPTHLSFSPYGGRLAFGLRVSAERAARAATLEDMGVAVVVPAPSIERVNAIAALCMRDSPTRAQIDTVSTRDAIPAFITQVEALPEGAIPPACKADLLAVARAVVEAGQG